MEQIFIRNFQKEDMPKLAELYKVVTAGEDRLFWWVGNEENYINVFCAFEGDKMIAKGQVSIINIIPPGRPKESRHEIYINLKPIPDREDDFELLNSLYKHLENRAIELKETLPNDYETCLCVGNFSNESKNNEFFTQKGYTYKNSLYSMRRILNEPIQKVSLAEPFKYAPWKMETPSDEKLYLDIESEIWPDAPLGYNKLHQYKRYPNWTAMVVHETETIVGSLMTWNQDGKGIIEDVFVRKHWRNQGIARFLLSQALSYLKMHNLTEARLVVLATNDSALALYQSVGFKIHNEEIRFFRVLSS